MRKTTQHNIKTAQCKVRCSLCTRLQKCPPSKAWEALVLLPEGREFQVLPPATPLCQLGQVSQARDSHSSERRESDGETNWAKTRNALGTEPGTRQVYGERPLPHYPEAPQEAELVHSWVRLQRGPTSLFSLHFWKFLLCGYIYEETQQTTTTKHKNNQAGKSR